MTRRGARVNAEWQTPEKGWTWEHVAIEVLMDIREELRGIHRLVACGNVSAGFVAMRSIDKHMQKRFPVKKKVKSA